MSSDLQLTNKQEKRIINAIAEAEKRTSSEIRVHIEANCPIDPLERAAQVFRELGMSETKLQNGVLIYIAAEDHKVAVYAGKGIHRKVPDGFWDGVLKLLIKYFTKDNFEAGIAKAIVKVGDQLEEIYPFEKGDINELSDEISYS